MFEINITEIALYAFGIATIIQIIWHLFIYPSIIIPPKKILNTVKNPVSVIICARNEGDNLKQYLPLILKQDYPDFEVIVVDDCSEDDTEFILKRLETEYKNLRSTKLYKDPKFNHGKKLALTVGIKSAKNDVLLLTDADCYPESDQWLKSFVKRFSHGKEIVLGYGGYIPKKGFLDKLIRFDTMNVAMNYLSAARIGLPYMGVGRNLAYKKDLFFNNKGFASHYGLLSGDDDLFINEVATRKNTTVLLDKGTGTRSVQSTCFRNWIYQKRRHLTTGKRYKFGTKLFLGFEPLSRVSFFIGGIICLLAFRETIYFNYILYAIGIRQLLQLITFKLAMVRLSERNLLVYSLLFDFLQPIIYTVFISNNFIARRRKKWK